MSTPSSYFGFAITVNKKSCQRSNLKKSITILIPKHNQQPPFNSNHPTKAEELIVTHTPHAKFYKFYFHTTTADVSS
jgi:hypothetical protein